MNRMITMNRTITLLAVGMLFLLYAPVRAELTDAMKAEGWVAIFDGKTLEGWKTNEGSDGFNVVDGSIVGTGGRNHLYFMEELRNFELKADVKINNDGNAGIFVKSQWEEAAWPTSGFELQINSSHGDRQKTGSLYDIIRIYEAPHKDDEWFTYHIICRGNELHVRINDKPLYTYVDRSRPARGGQGGETPPITSQNKRISQPGYIALQQHHVGSVVQFKNIFLKRLPETQRPN